MCALTRHPAQTLHSLVWPTVQLGGTTEGLRTGQMPTDSMPSWPAADSSPASSTCPIGLYHPAGIDPQGISPVAAWFLAQLDVNSIGFLQPAPAVVKTGTRHV